MTNLFLPLRFVLPLRVCWVSFRTWMPNKRENTFTQKINYTQSHDVKICIDRAWGNNGT